MAKDIVTVYRCDKCGTEGAETRAVNLGDGWYEFELCDSDFTKMFVDLARLMVDRGRKMSRMPKGEKSVKSVPHVTAQKKALDHGRHISQQKEFKGRSPCEVCGDDVSNYPPARANHMKRIHAEAS